MANTRLSMRKIKEVLRLTHDGHLNTRQVALSLNISRSTMSLSSPKTRSVFDRYNIVSEVDLTKATERLQQHLEEQPRAPLVVPIIIVPSKAAR
jgi:hypothetical protein